MDLDVLRLYGLVFHTDNTLLSGNPGTGGGSRVYTGAGNNPNQANGNNYVDIGGLSANTQYYFTCTSYVDALGWGNSYNVSVRTKNYTVEDILNKYISISYEGSNIKLEWFGNKQQGGEYGTKRASYTVQGNVIKSVTSGPATGGVEDGLSSGGAIRIGYGAKKGDIGTSKMSEADRLWFVGKQVRIVNSRQDETVTIDNATLYTDWISSMTPMASEFICIRFSKRSVPASTSYYQEITFL